MSSNAQERSALDVIRKTLMVGSDGAVTFRSRTGRGSGRPIIIPGDQFDEFVNLMQRTQKDRSTMAEHATQVASEDKETSDE